MSYIGKTPTIGNFQVCDAISVVNGQAAYTMQVSSVNVIPESANHMLVSLNGILQKPGSSYTVSGSTITFASNLVTGDVIDFIQILGNVLDLGVPSDATVTAAKLNNDIISGSTELASEPADTDEFLVSDDGVLKRIDYSLIKGGGTHVEIATADYSSAVSSFTLTDCFTSAYSIYKVYLYDILFASDDSEMRMYFQDSSNSDVNGWLSYATKAGARDDGGADDTGHEGGGISDYVRFGANDFESASNEVSALEVTIIQPYETTNTLINFNLMQRSDNGHFYSIVGGARLNVNTSLENIKFQSHNGTNFSSYKTVIYGVKRS